ncbi:MAG: DNA repair protein RecN [Prevotellaceae bacterium]|jgi:DNA repair protein RecN (Recombination protein N)|nr:DNA repair protein RecN [Prevotellaceae bacterium]
MLRHLEVQNYAMIENLSIDFQSGLSVVTGETGAGKSIILGALGLVLGARSDAKVILSDADKCVVEAVFDVSKYNVKPLLNEFEVDYFDDCIIRREVLANGKSRSFINDTPVNLLQLKELSSLLIDIHSQHENLLLGNVNFQLNILDLIAQTTSELNNYRNLYNNYTAKKNYLKSLQEKFQKAFEEKDYAQFQFEQLSEAKLVEKEQAELENELDLINHSQEVCENLTAVSAAFSEERVGAENQLKSALNYIRKIEKYLPQEQNFSERIHSLLIDIKDINSEIEQILNNTEFNAERKNFVAERLNLIYSLQQKHRVKTVAELMDLQRVFEQKLNEIEVFDEEVLKLKNEIFKIENNLKAAAKILSDKRKSLQKAVTEQVEATLALLGMPNAKFELSFAELENFTANGLDKVEFLFSANKNRSSKPIYQVASGGELSRLMLVIKSLVIKTAKLPTIIFDEIDTGISGETAKKMGAILKQMGENMQVIAITHLPQIAAKGNIHYKVFKDESGKASRTGVVQLSENERITEIAQMISGKDPSETAINSAKELLCEQF